MGDNRDMSGLDIQYTAWRKKFVLWPVKTINNKRVWLATVYQRTATDPIKWDLFHDQQVIKEYATLFEVLSGEDQ